MQTCDTTGKDKVG